MGEKSSRRITHSPYPRLGVSSQGEGKLESEGDLGMNEPPRSGDEAKDLDLEGVGRSHSDEDREPPESSQFQPSPLTVQTKNGTE